MTISKACVGLFCTDNKRMTKKWFQISLKGILFFAVVVAAYLAGRTPWERAAILSQTQTLAWEHKHNQLSLYASVWREIALEHRDDIRVSGIDWRREQIKRFGGGLSIPGGPNDDEIRPREKRWQIAFSTDPEIAKKQLDSLKALIVCVWDNPPRMEQWDSNLAQFREISPNEKLEHWLIIAGGEEIFSILPDSVFDDKPRFVLVAIPEQTMIEFIRLESSSQTKHNISLKEIDSTLFGFGISNELILLDLKLKSMPK